MDTSFGANETSFTPFVLLPVVLSSVWILWDLFYASYLLAFLVQCIVNLYLKDTKIYIGQLRLNLVTGRLIFKEIEIYRRDDSIRVADGYGVLRWWAKPNPTDNEARCEQCSFQSHACANKKTSLVYLHLNGFEYHWYHRSDIYDAWGQTKINEYDSDGPAGSAWLIGVQPSVHCTINKGQLVFGSQLVENNLVVCFTRAEGQYAVTQASNPYDELMHLVKFHGDNVTAFLQPVNAYNNRISTSKFELFDVDDGFNVLKTDFVECVYSLDIPGLVPIDDTTSPKYSFDIQLGTNTYGKYGTYVNNQRVILQKHFFPNDYTVSQVDRPRQPGERRVYTSFDVSISVTSPATLHFEFQGKSDPQSLSFSVSGASQLLIHQPWVIKDDGYTTKFSGKLTDLEVLTSLPFQPLGKAHCVNLSSSLHFPRVWNSTQAWHMKFLVDQPQINILFPYIDFFNELLDDWVQSDTIDILDFVPFQWHIGVEMSEYEIFLFTNRYNWIDTDEVENERIAVCGKTGHLSLDLPFTEFLPDRQEVTFHAHGKNIVVRRYFSPSSVSKESVFALSSVHKKRWRIINPSELHPVYSLTRSASQPIKPCDAEVNIVDRNIEKGTTSFKKAHRRRGSEPLVSHSQKYMKHDFDYDKQNTELQNGNESFPMGCCLTTFYKDGWLDICCGPEITINITYNGHNSDMSHVGSSNDMVPSQVLIDINAPQVLLRVFGTLARDLLSLKENYPGEYMYFKTYSSRSCALPDCLSKTKDATDSVHSEIVTDERFLEVIVNFKLQRVTGEFPTHYPENFCDEFPLPSAHSECLSVYVEYKRQETIVKLTVDPITVHLPFLVDGKEHKLGVVALSGVTFCCHGLTEILLKERVEYAWMMKLNIGAVSASVSLNELFPVVHYFLTALSHVISPADAVLEAPDCILIEPLVEPSSELLKYKMFVLEVATIDLILKEADTMLQIQTLGFGLDLCNLHQGTETVSLSAILKSLNASFLIEIPECSGVYCECACFDVGAIEGDFSLREPLEADSNRQKSFLKLSDLSHRLWFLWDNCYTCGCCGGCQFLDGCISREDYLPVSHSSRYFAKVKYDPIINRSPRSLPEIPLHLSIDNVPSLECLHNCILKYYGFADLQRSGSMNLQEHDDDELVSRDSEASFDTAKSSFQSDSFSGDEHFASLQNSPSGSTSATRVDNSNEIQENDIVEKKKDNFLSLYWQILDKYLFCNNLLQLNCKKLQKSKNKSQGKALFTIDFPEIIESNVGVLPYICYSGEYEVSNDCKFSKESGKDSDKTSSAYVVSVTLVGNIGLVISPPLLALINQYVSCVNGFVSTLCLQSFLDVISLQTLWNVKSDLESSKKLPNLAVHQDQPLIYFSVNTSATSHILLQALNAISIPCKNIGRKNDNICCSFLTFHSTGIGINSLLYREGHVNSKESNNGGDVQVCHKVAGEVNISVLELGLFVHNLNEEGISSVNSSLNFSTVMPPSSHLPRMIDICEGRLKQLNVTVAALITELDRKITPILTWDHIESHLLDVSAIYQTKDSDFNNSLVLQVKLPSIELQVGKPSHGIANEKDIFVDPAIFATFVRGWKPMLDKIIENLQNTQINKVIFEKNLLLQLLRSAQEASVNRKVLNPLLTKESLAVQNCVCFLLLRQLWNGLPQAKKESKRCSVKSNMIDKEIISISLSLALVVLSDQICHVSGDGGEISSYQAPLVSSYHSISPSPSGLGIPNVAFLDQIGKSYKNYSKNMSYSHFVLLRESLLPVYKVCGMKITSQVMRSGQDSFKLNIDYYLRVNELSLIVANNEVSPLDENLKHPELLVKHFCVSGSLDYVVKLCNLERKINYVVTVPQSERPHRSSKYNVVSKCSLNFDSLACHITLPLLVVVRHTAQSLRHVKDIFVDFEVTLLLVRKYEEETLTCDRKSNVTEFTSYLCALERSALSSCQTDISLVSEQFETCNNPNKSSSEIHVNPLDLSQSSSMSGHLDSPVEVPANSHLLSSSSPYDADVVEDTTDSPQFFSSDPEAPVQSSMATYGASKSTLKMSSNDVVENEQLDLSISPGIKDMLNINESNLDFSIFGSVKISNIQVCVGIESFLLLCEMHEISGAVDCRTVSPKNWQSHPHAPLSYKVLPSYISLASTLKKFVLSAQDHAISNKDLGNLISEDLEFCTSICYLKEYVAPAYRCLVRFPGILLDMKQPPIVLHKKLNKYIPTFSAIYEEIFASSPDSFVDDAGFVGATPAVSVAELQFPPHIPKGSALFFLKKFKTIVRPLPSLMVSYDIAPVVAQIGSTTVIKLVLSIGQHKLEFNSKEYKDDLSLRPIPLPVVLLRGKVTPRPHSRLPSVTLEVSVKQVVIEVTTNVLNQLLILQSAFIKETNELFNMFMNIGESLPQDRLNAINLTQPADTGFELISLLNSVKLSMQGVKITVSTPLLTAVRFSTGNKIEMLITNVSHQHNTQILANKSHLTLHGKVETEINVALGCIQGGQNVEEEEDDFVELAYFKTWIAFKNTLQQNTSKADLAPVMSDIFLISIYSPHLYIQSTAVEKAILFWVNCKSVYNFWQNEHHQLNTEVQAATEAFVGRLTKPAVQIKAPSIDFSKPRLVQITVSDVGACMPLVHLQTTPHASQKGFPAVVLTIKEMFVSLNFSKKLVSAGRFTGFLVRFDEQFHFRHKTWTVDPKKHKFLNHGIVPSGTYKLCIVNKNDLEENEKLFTAFKWHMSGINVYASTDIGRHISTLVRTLTIIGSDLEDADSELLSASGESKPLHKRAFSVSSKTFVDEQETLRAMEWDLAKQTRKLNKMRQTGVAPDNLKYEEDTFHKIEMDLVRGLRRVFRKGKGFSFQHIGQILSPRTAGLSGLNKKPVSPSSTLPRNRLD
ncbi:PREDICTED: uncharacterized protein KIAA1109-like isoform X3 [Amphimedon queenslandica]|uniref:Uncharacterized protein n=1 Tax=Amphimedon queenslandica TaxID=400682 RepID=A0AAN0J8P3_AMPQE|nr:PREDICTED: uncharacterized protein KIAA1109-like isoform X3 [Amphimedon queenslandica]|eukprot:XP_019853101.1 PREDICTED: uncharacterized protein KIAA1109-like isoform X3 [Amphimedon queenslandica]